MVTPLKEELIALLFLVYGMSNVCHGGVIGRLSSVIVALPGCLFRPRHTKTCVRAYADSEDPDQPAQPRSLIRDFTVPLQDHWILQNV